MNEKLVRELISEVDKLIITIALSRKLKMTEDVRRHFDNVNRLLKLVK